MLLMMRIGPQAEYATSVLPAVVVFGLGLALTAAPLTAAVLAAADARHVGVAPARQQRGGTTGGLARRSALAVAGWSDK